MASARSRSSRDDTGDDMRSIADCNRCNPSQCARYVAPHSNRTFMHSSSTPCELRDSSIRRIRSVLLRSAAIAAVAFFGTSTLHAETGPAIAPAPLVGATLNGYVVDAETKET